MKNLYFKTEDFIHLSKEPSLEEVVAISNELLDRNLVLNPMIEKAPVDSLLDEVEEYMKNICGDKFSDLNPCANKEVLNRIKEFRSNE